MTRQTSLEAYSHLITSGIINQRQLDAWLGLEQWGPMTGRELDEQLGTRGLWRRLPELKALGLVRERTIRTCRISKRAATVWEHTTANPDKPFHKLTPKPHFYLAVTATGKILHASTERRPSATVADIHQCELVMVREVKRYAPK